MTFAWPLVLWLLAVPAAFLATELLRRRGLSREQHPKILRAEAGMKSVSLTEETRAKPSAHRRYLLCAGLAFAIVALARPQWGRLDEPVFDQSRDIVIALDLSRSMLTPDVRPSRLERAKLLVQSLLDKLKGERVGLIVFSGSAFLQSPVSSDYEILREFLPALSPDYMPEGGTNYGQLIDTALDAFSGESAADRYLVILSDGEATDEGWQDKVPELTKRGIRVIGLGVGTSGGGMIPDGAGAFMKDENGAVVLSKLESGTLRDLAKATHGVYKDASEWVDLASVISSTVDKGRKGRFVEHNNVRYAERYQWALAQALLCLVASFLLEFPVEPKSRAIRLSGRGAQAAAALLFAFLVIALPRARAAEAAPPDNAAALAKVVGRLAAQDGQSAVDWAEMGSDTVSWGQGLKSGGQQVPDGPVRDALRAVEEGRKDDPKAADWPKLQSELEELLNKPEEKQQDQQKQQDQDKKNQDQGKEQNQSGNPDQKNQDQKNKDQQNQEKPDRDKNSGQQNSNQQQSPSTRSQEEKRNHESAFGKMGPTPTPPPSRGSHDAMQRVGGARKEQDNDPARNDPELAVPLERLEQLKAQDSPAELFQNMREGEPTPTPASGGKNW